ncbi:MAG: LytTR family DNA-binding domain-containing protein [Aestuariibacter sp.]
MTVEMALSRNLIYLFLGLTCCLFFLPLWEYVGNLSYKSIIPTLLLYAYGVGLICSVIVNYWILFAFDIVLTGSRSGYIYGGALNFSLVILVWCGFYLSLKTGLNFEQGAEEKKAAEAIASISSLTTYPEYIALERLNKISLLPVSKISLIKAAGDYVELTCDSETYLKRETLSNIHKILNPKTFQRIHRSAIVNLNEIREMEAKGRGDFNIILQSGENVASSRTYMNALKNRIDIAI